jgi:hypothetical protein
MNFAMRALPVAFGFMAMTMPFVFSQSQNDHIKGTVIMRLFCGYPPWRAKRVFYGG